MLILILLGFFIYAFHTLWISLNQMKSAAEFGISLPLRLAWIASILLLLSIYGLFQIPAIRDFLSIDLLFAFFVPAFVTGRHIQKRLEVLGTSRTEKIEDAASQTTWLAIFSAALVALLAIIRLASMTVGAPKYSF